LITEFNLTIRAVNSNKQIGVYYWKTNRVAVLYAGKELCTGSFPAFYQGYHNTINLKVGVMGSWVRILQGLRSNLDVEQRKGKVPLVVAIDVPTKIKVGQWKSPEIIARLRCRLIVNKLAAKENPKEVGPHRYYTRSQARIQTDLNTESGSEIMDRREDSHTPPRLEQPDPDALLSALYSAHEAIKKASAGLGLGMFFNLRITQRFGKMQMGLPSNIMLKFSSHLKMRHNNFISGRIHDRHVHDLIE
ncbi:hypothetical protein KI387_032921, partial [Taxus chinensis]